MPKHLAPALVALSIFALPAAATAAPSLPAWCAAKAPHEAPTDGDLDSAAKATDPAEALYELVGLACNTSTDPAALPGVAKLRQRWSAELGLADGDWPDVVDWATQSDSARVEYHLHARPDLPLATMSPMQQYASISWAGLNGLDPFYLADALGSRLSAAARVAVIDKCVESKLPVLWAMCAGDVAALDPAKVAAELHANGAPASWERIIPRLNAFALRGRLAAHAGDVKAAIASDAAYGKMFEIAAQARAAWDARGTQDAALRDLALAMDDAAISQSKRAAAGCGDQTMAAWRAAIGAIPARAFARLRPVTLRGGSTDALASEVTNPLHDQVLAIIIDDPAGYLAANALALCGESTLPLRDVLVRAPGQRGPRSAAQTAMMRAGLELDRKGAAIDWYGGGEEAHLLHARPEPTAGRGVVLAVKAGAGGKTTVEFDHHPGTYETCDDERVSSRVERIAPDGTLVYERTCLKSSRRPIDLRDEPQTLAAGEPATLARGMFAVIEDGVVTVAWAKPDAKVPAVIFGVPVR